MLIKESKIQDPPRNYDIRILCTLAHMAAKHMRPKWTDSTDVMALQTGKADGKTSVST